MTRISLLVTRLERSCHRRRQTEFQTVDTDFSPDDRRPARKGIHERYRFQTVDTDFSPGDIAKNELGSEGGLPRFRPLTRISLLVTPCSVLTVPTGDTVSDR